ncbi:MAG TPA: lytic transglycosylase domain-containing protein [Clostridia bacterium]|nr:lytic transglycosylase domain-containing protein [Clostridia bacterium]
MDSFIIATSFYNAPLEYDLEKEFLYAVIKTESSFKTDALSSAGAQGLMQITPETFEWLQMKMGGEHLVLDCNDADLNVKYGAYFLKLLLDEFENKNTALAAYHAGRGRVNEWLDNPDFSTDGVTLDSIPYRDTEYYVKKVNKAENIYRNLY